ncbi:MAG: polysaccharide biosynthesis/export family protein [Gammaproteobacteria bacterium]|nr:polysaccharide biosynthesis/export family protein [Gammaproteobacteria bacterium]
MQRLTNLFQSLLIMTVLVSCGSNPVVVSAPDAPAGETKYSTTAPKPETSATTVKEPQETVTRDTYVVQPGDVLNISVWREKDLQGDIAVRPDGALNFPLVGEIVAAGKTIQQLKTDISTKLSKYVPDPVVTVVVKNSLGNKIFVIGKVNRPGEFVANRNMDVMQALSMAGGLNPYASENKIKILRRINDEQVTFRFRYSQVEKGENLEQNIVLQGGDVVIVP